VEVPVLGRIAAGAPVLAEENVETHVAVAEELAGSGELFALRVQGDSMVEAGILDGDLVVVRRQDVAGDGAIVAALVPGPAEDEATVKRLRRTGRRVILVPENPAMEPFDMPEGGRLLGVVVAVLRKL
jgi:repressor LexA